MNHTETPWTIWTDHKGNHQIERRLNETEGETVCHITSTTVDAQFIVQACNAHEELVKALESTIIPLIRLGDFVGNIDKGGASELGSFDRCAILLQVNQALSKAKEVPQ